MEKTASKEKSWREWHIAEELQYVLERSKNVIIPKKREELIELSLGSKENSVYDVEYEVPGKGNVIEAQKRYCCKLSRPLYEKT